MPHMRKNLLLLLALAIPAVGCGQTIDDIKPVAIPFGTRIGMDDKVKGESHMREISYEKFASLVVDKESFVVMIHSTTNFCSCWDAFHRDVFVPYVKARGTLVYYVDYQNIEGKENYGLTVLPNHETIGIFESGKLKYQENNSDQKSEWTTSAAYFAQWMDARVSKPKAFYVSKEQLDGLYDSRNEFTILFTRSTCPDCAYLESNDLKSWLNAADNPSPLYMIDCDVIGIRYVTDEAGKIYGPSSAEDASEKQIEAFEQWSDFKSEYGLAYSEDNPAGWDSGYVPTIYHVNPDGANRSGDVIDASGVFYNDARLCDSRSNPSEDTAISSTYFTAERLQIDAMQYLRESNLANKVLTGLKADGANRHEAFKPYHSAILDALLTWCIGN